MYRYCWIHKLSVKITFNVSLNSYSHLQNKRKTFIRDFLLITTISFNKLKYFLLKFYFLTLPNTSGDSILFSKTIRLYNNKVLLVTTRKTACLKWIILPWTVV